MKLIDILVSDLPEMGGWPDGNSKCWAEVEPNGVAYVHFNNRPYFLAFPGILLGRRVNINSVTKEQYEAAVANIGKSIPCRCAMVEIKPQWDGTGLPPVGTECEIYQHPEFGVLPGTAETGTKVKVVAHETTTGKNSVAVVFWSVDGAGHSDVFIAQCLRPLGSAAAEEEKHKRQETELALTFVLTSLHRGQHVTEWSSAIVEAIAAGKIPRINLDDGK